MTKVRGFHVELAEVEAALERAEQRVQNAAAVVVSLGPSGDAGDANLHIVGFVAPADVEVPAIRERLVDILPASARPSYVSAVPQLPTTSNSKVDRSELGEIAFTKILGLGAAEDELDGGTDEGTDEEGDLSPTGKIVAQVWKEVLRLESDVRLGRDDDWFDWGGCSLLALKATKRIGKALSRSIPNHLLLQESNLGRLSDAIDDDIRDKLWPTLCAFGASGGANLTPWLKQLDHQASAPVPRYQTR
ncbi:hypothetical protein F5Y17DRAFT_120246 [Xylariaceae sp. FL0594]|nr:hypothetical protein F5Y17DRAFT_120246 [Xylariaceae sp. FL0594]